MYICMCVCACLCVCVSVCVRVCMMLDPGVQQAPTQTASINSNSQCLSGSAIN